MSDFDWDDDENDNASESTGMKQLRAALRAEKKRNQEIMDELTTLKTVSRERAVKDIVASKGLPEKIAKLIPADVTSPEDVENWVAEYADLFGAVAPQSNDEEHADNRADLQAWQNISATQKSGQPFDGDFDQMDARIRAAQTPEELNKVLFGNSYGPQAF